EAGARPHRRACLRASGGKRVLGEPFGSVCITIDPVLRMCHEFTLDFCNTDGVSSTNRSITDSGCAQVLVKAYTRAGWKFAEPDPFRQESRGDCCNGSPRGRDKWQVDGLLSRC